MMNYKKLDSKFELTRISSFKMKTTFIIKKG